MSDKQKGAFDLQALFDRMSVQARRERAKTQMTLGQLIAILEALPPTVPVVGLRSPHSYRGYYCDLAFEPTDEMVTAEQLLTICRFAMGRAFRGYKGGDFVMGESTPVWIAHYGDSGIRLMAIHPNGAIETAEEE